MILIRVNLMYHRSLYYKGQCYVLSFQSNQTGTYPSHTHIHKIIPYVVACIPPYKGQSYLLSFQSNQPGMYPSHAHIHMNKPFDVCSCIALLCKTAIPGATLKMVSGLATNELSHHPQISILTAFT